jgi:hypothetical protein
MIKLIILPLAVLTFSMSATAENACSVPMITTAQNYTCLNSILRIKVSATEYRKQSNWFVASVNYRVIDQRTGNILDRGAGLDSYRECDARGHYGDKHMRKYAFGQPGNGSIYAFALSDNDRGAKYIWYNSPNFPGIGYLRCTKN